MKRIKTILLGGCAVIALTACDKLGSPMDAITGKRTTPDEFQVVTRKPLRMPGSANLPEPRLGERSPLEHDPGGDAREVLTGSRATGGGAASEGERALVGAAAGNATTGPVSGSLAEREAKLNKDKPYSPPSLAEWFAGEKTSKADLLDPDAEARRLRSGGTAKTPVNPNDANKAEESEDGYVSPGEKYEPKFPYGNQKKGS